MSLERLNTLQSSYAEFIKGRIQELKEKYTKVTLQKQLEN